MKEYVDAIKDFFIDYAGNKHHFVIVTVSSEVDTELADYCMGHVENKNFIIDCRGDIVKEVKVGISICNPEDKYDEKIGFLKALKRAKNSNDKILVTNKGFINTKVIRAFLEQEAEYLKDNPEKYIKGYADTKARYLKRIEMEKLSDNFSELEHTIVNNVEENPKFLDNVKTYLEWSKKCKKRGK